METKETFVFNRIEIEGKPSIEQLISWFQNQMYKEDYGLGFTSITNEDGIIVAQILFRSPSYIQHYNAANGLFEKQVINIYGELELLYDIDNNMIYTTSSQTKFAKAKTLLRESIKSRITFSNIEFSAKTMFEKVQKMGFMPFITDLTIKQFKYKEGAIGRYSVHLDDKDLGYELMDSYSDSINRMTVQVQSNKYPDFILSIASQNSLTIKCREDNLWPIINDLKSYL